MEEKKNETLSNMETTGKGLRPFNIEAAKAGKPVCTRDGRKARIICFDRVSTDGKSEIVACIMSPKRGCEDVLIYDSFGCFVNSDKDLMMLTEKHEGWINVVMDKDGYYYCNGVYNSEEIARKKVQNYPNSIISTVKIEWED